MVAMLPEPVLISQLKNKNKEHLETPCLVHDWEECEELCEADCSLGHIHNKDICLLPLMLLLCFLWYIMNWSYWKNQVDPLQTHVPRTVCVLSVLPLLLGMDLNLHLRHLNAVLSTSSTHLKLFVVAAAAFSTVSSLD